MDPTKHTSSPESVARHTSTPSRVLRLAPMESASASTPAPPSGQWPAGSQLHTVMVRVVVLESGGAPLSASTTGRRYWVRSLRVKELRRATMLAVLSGDRWGGGAVREGV